MLCRVHTNYCFLDTKGETFEEFNHTRSCGAFMTPILTRHGFSFICLRLLPNVLDSVQLLFVSKRPQSSRKLGRVITERVRFEPKWHVLYVKTRCIGESKIPLASQRLLSDVSMV